MRLQPSNTYAKGSVDLVATQEWGYFPTKSWGSLRCNCSTGFEQVYDFSVLGPLELVLSSKTSSLYP